jgi:hypothetical protein
VAEDRIRILRILEYEGPRSWVETALTNRGVKGEKIICYVRGEKENPCLIREAILGTFPEIVTKGETENVK